MLYPVSLRNIFSRGKMSENHTEIKEQSMASLRIQVERTLALIKPDVLHKAEEIEDIILRSGFQIVQKIKVHLSPEKCSDFYSEQYGKMFFPSLTAYMSSGPIIALVLARHDAINFWRQIMGPSNSLQAKETHPESIRSIYGTDDFRNAVHGSYCLTSAEREIRFMFPEAPIEPMPAGQNALDYLDLFVNPTLLSGCINLCKRKPSDPYIWLADWLLKHNTSRPEVANESY
ncbi:nucleoside diphosphate kinase homolog 5 isoform X1 [Ranitomeya variabilis]|uniref:nucleoside diphosphate kinase homolog 5 isoform X1 n=2 Tax=Ranitomeya variabilis TaxID=490064 RepID=UPI004057C136